jgi:osmoprotectant transport system ATP-binding protein
VTDPIVDIREVSYRASGRDILRNINLRVNPGETIVLLGRSGSGKTTLLRMINRLIEPASGEIVVEGKPLTQWDPIRLRRGIGYVIQDGGLFPHRTVQQNIGLVPRLEGQPSVKVTERVHDLMRTMGLAPEKYAARYPRQLSGGEKQRVGIARALAADPQILLLDEPFAALDPITRFELQRHFLQLRAELGKTAVFVTHDIREALMMASRVAVLHNGLLETVVPVEEFPNASTPEARTFLATIQDRT